MCVCLCVMYVCSVRGVCVCVYVFVHVCLCVYVFVCMYGLLKFPAIRG